MRADAREVLTLGETMVLVAPAAGQRLTAKATYSLSAAGAESNVAITLARLGLSVTWLSRLGADALGDLVLDELRKAGVDTSFVEVVAHAPTGVFFKSPGEFATQVLYYRRGSAASTMDAGVLDRLDGNTRLVHISGITPALSEGCAALIDAVVVERRLRDAHVAFDVNYRPALWGSVDDASRDLLRLARSSDIVFVGRDEAHTLWGVSTAEGVRSLLPDVEHVVVKDAEVEAVEFNRDQVHRVPSLPVEVVEPVGAGDAFAAGWESALLRGHGPEARLHAGHLCAAEVLRSPTDQAVSLESVRNIIEKRAS